jgi:hypothetical protein
VSRPDRSGADQIDAEHQATDLAVGVRNPRGAPQSRGQTAEPLLLLALESQVKAPVTLLAMWSLA